MSCKKVEVDTDFEVDFNLVVDVQPLADRAEVDKVATSEAPQVFWLNLDTAAKATSANYFVRGSETRSFRGLEVVEATSVVKAAGAMQAALVQVSTVMNEHNVPEEVINAVLNALELAKINNVLKYRPRTIK